MDSGVLLATHLAALWTQTQGEIPSSLSYIGNALHMIAVVAYLNQPPSSPFFRPNADHGIAFGVCAVPLTLYALHSGDASSFSSLFTSLLLLSSLVDSLLMILTLWKPEVLYSRFRTLAVALLGCVLTGFLGYALAGIRATGDLAFLSLQVFIFTLAWRRSALSFGRSFSAGELSFLCQIISLLGADAATSTLSTFVGPNISFANVPRSHVFVLSQSLILGMLLVPTAISFPLSKLPKTSKESSPSWTTVALIYIGFVAFIASAIWPWTWFSMGEEPFSWVINGIAFNQNRLGLFAMFFGLASSAYFVDSWLRRPAETYADVNVRRKFFHAVAVLMFIGGYWVDPSFLRLSFAVAQSLFIFLEILRFNRVPPIADALDSYLKHFTAKTDMGPLVVSHIYLLIGCAGPVWLDRLAGGEPNVTAALSGIIALGVGDSLASLIGIRYGYTKWPGHSTSFEGSAAFVVGTLAAIAAVRWIWAVPSLLSWMTVSIVIGASVMEATSFQNDNLILPIFLFAAFRQFEP
ncbi:hypothetical protein M427DRAFT_58640 [Gonapodya prolifera JEL478]|uniref:dolichol kinase n=1 Tax=Gonapodya prolifera (strain JEL478) TaxID=1344416 RepID=A0A139A9Q4_GONPJ|nr:hypothetical protein M427DRAFT_58640 [Gonapodya prolifera JEL478]|eukprot:KXS13399.1 hypothetical protein M427DRAFT_58640 [Gonapodya prolifera JEL478]